MVINAPRPPRPTTVDERLSDQHRYTGPELSALLNQVRLELGAEANIVEANRVRSGGVAGFFAKESYEVVVAAPAGAATTRGAVPAADDDGTTGAKEPTRASHPARPPVRSPRSPAEISIALLERAEAISAMERASVQRHRPTMRTIYETAALGTSRPYSTPSSHPNRDVALPAERRASEPPPV